MNKYRAFLVLQHSREILVDFILWFQIAAEWYISEMLKCICLFTKSTFVDLCDFIMAVVLVEFYHSIIIKP